MAMAREKIEGLTASWYSAVVITAGVNLLRDFGIISMFTGAIGLAIGLFVTWFIGKRLLARSGFWRMVVLILAPLGILVGGYGCFKMTLAFLTSWHFGLLIDVALTFFGVVLNARSFNVLTSSEVKAYFR